LVAVLRILFSADLWFAMYLYYYSFKKGLQI
jgi:hypothetical protein